MKKIFILLIILTFSLIYSHSSNYDHNIIKLSNRQTIGDINEDGEINIQDVILLVDLVISNEYNDLADINGDNIINIIDVVQLVNIILIECGKYAQQVRHRFSLSAQTVRREGRRPGSPSGGTGGGGAPSWHVDH